MRTDRLGGLEGDLLAMIVEEITFGEEVRTDTDLLLGGLVDSVAVIRIVTWMEDHLEMDIDPVDVVLENFRTIDQMVEYARRREPGQEVPTP